MLNSYQQFVDLILIDSLNIIRHGETYDINIRKRADFSICVNCRMVFNNQQKKIPALKLEYFRHPRMSSQSILNGCCLRGV